MIRCLSLNEKLEDLMMSSTDPKGFAGISYLVTDIAARMREIKISTREREDLAEPKFREARRHLADGKSPKEVGKSAIYVQIILALAIGLIAVMLKDC